jgi:hypothetical protein
VPRLRPRAIAAPLLVVYLSTAGCYSWQPSPYRLPPEEMPDRMVIVRHDGYRFTLDNPRIVGDSIRGDVAPSIALADVASAEAWSISGRQTLGVAGVLLGLAGVIAVLLAFPDLDGKATINGS